MFLSGCSSVKFFQKKVPEAPKIETSITKPVSDSINYAKENLPKFEVGEIVSIEKNNKQEEVRDLLSIVSKRIKNYPEPELDFNKLKKSVENEIKSAYKEEEKVNNFLNKYEGEKIEGTGISINKAWSFLLIIVACVIFPQLIPVLIMIVNKVVQGISYLFASLIENIRTTKAAKQTVSGIEKFLNDSSVPDNIKIALKSELSKSHDYDVKKLIKKIKENNNKVVPD
jgi:hypothetical protein